MASRRLVPVLSVLVALVAVVAGAAVWWDRKHNQFDSERFSRPAPELGNQAHQLLPNVKDAEVVVPNRPHDPQEIRAEDRATRVTRVRRFTVSTNSQGYRGPEFAETVSHPRILCVGDSVTFGWGVAFEESYPARLSKLLGVEVLNVGVPALKPDHMGNWIEAEAASFEPDIILFTARPNHARPDPYGDYKRALTQATASGARVGLVLPPISTFDPMGNANRAAELKRVHEIAARVPGGPIPVLELTDAFRAALPRPGYVMEQQSGRQVVRKLPENTIVMQPEAPGRGLAPEIIAAFEADDSFTEPLFFDGGHPDAEGFEIFSAAVATWTRQQFL